MKINGGAIISGQSKPNSHVRLLNSDGEEIATAAAGADGKWEVPNLMLPAGKHLIHARCKTPDSSIEQFSNHLSLEIQAEADDAADATDLEESDSIFDQAEERYAKIVRARASGFSIDQELGEWVLAHADRTMDDFNEDVEREIRLIEREQLIRDRLAAL